MSYPPVEGTQQYYLDYEYILMILSIFWFGAGVIAVLAVRKLISWRRTRAISWRRTRANCTTMTIGLLRLIYLESLEVYHDKSRAIISILLTLSAIVYHYLLFFLTDVFTRSRGLFSCGCLDDHSAGFWNGLGELSVRDETDPYTEEDEEWDEWSDEE